MCRNSLKELIELREIVACDFSYEDFVDRVEGMYDTIRHAQALPSGQLHTHSSSFYDLRMDFWHASDSMETMLVSFSVHAIFLRICDKTLLGIGREF